jgi:transposase
MKQMQVYAGLDMHSATITGTIKDTEGNPLRVLKVETSKEGVKKLFDRYNKKQVNVVFEASKNWYYYAQLLKPYSNNIIMAHPRKIRAIASARIKTDAIDSNILCDLLRGNLIPESYMPCFEIVELRELLRYRAGLSNLRARFKIKVRNIISREGKSCEWRDITAKAARLWLSNVQLTQLNRRELDYIVKLMDNVDAEIKELDKTIDKEQYKYPEVDLLKSIVGISTFSALLILAEIADFSRFSTPHKLSAYAGLAPSTYQSSNTQYNGKITKQGSKWLRWILNQCTHASVKSRQSHRLKSFFLRLQRKKGTQKAIVATSRKMLVTIWHLLNKNEYYATRNY